MEWGGCISLQKQPHPRRCRALPTATCAPVAACRSDAEKEAAIAGERRVGTAKSMRVGPAAARQLLGLLRSDDPDLKIRQDAGEGS